MLTINGLTVRLGGRDITVRVGAQDAPYPAGFTTFLTGITAVDDHFSFVE